MRNKIFLAFMMIFACLNIHAKTVKDILGNEIEVKSEINKIYATTPAILYMLYALDKNKIAGLNYPFWKDEKKFMDPEIYSLPVLGGWVGKGKTPNIEMILKVNPDLILVSSFMKKHEESKIEKSFGKINIPLFYVAERSLEDTALSFLVLGDAIGKKERGQALHDWGMDAVNYAKEVGKKVKVKPRVYYTDSQDGLSTQCDKSYHDDLIVYAHATNVVVCDEEGKKYGKLRINFEQLLTHDPDMILVYNKVFFEEIFKDKKWQNLRAVRDKKVYFLPKGPFSWYNRPPSFMRFLGLKWLLTITHPHIVEIDLKKEMHDFYKLFLDFELSDEDIKFILKQ